MAAMHGVVLSLEVDNGEPSDELLSFSHWLKRLELTRDHELVRAEPEPGAMDAGVFTQLLLQVADPPTIGAMLVGLWQWQRSRQPRCRVTITSANGQMGEEVTIEVKNLSREELDRRLPGWVEQIRGLVGEPEPPPGTPGRRDDGEAGEE